MYPLCSDCPRHPANPALFSRGLNRLSIEYRSSTDPSTAPALSRGFKLWVQTFATRPRRVFLTISVGDGKVESHAQKGEKEEKEEAD